MSSGNSSNRPASMSNIRTYFDILLKNPKFCTGPTWERPGPILFIVAATAVKFVEKSYPSMDTIRVDATKTTINVIHRDRQVCARK